MAQPITLRFSNSRIRDQIVVVMLKNQPFDAPIDRHQLWTSGSVCDVLRSVPRFFFQPTRSIGRHKGFRHRAPPKQRNLKDEEYRLQENLPVLGPAAYRDPYKVELGSKKAWEFFLWVETHFGFIHDEMTCREMACVLALGNRLPALWYFLKEMSNRGNGLVTVATITCLIKLLGEQGLVSEALALFDRMKKYHFKPDVYAYNTIINALCRVGKFKKAKFLFEEMQLPGFRCPPDVFTYTIMITSYCRYSTQTACKKATRRRLYEANHLFRLMLFKGFAPDVVSYNCLIDGCCKTYRIERALELFKDMSQRGCTPNQVTYNSFIRYYSAVNEIDKAIEVLRMMQKMKHGRATSSSYTPIIHALCEAGKVMEARDFLLELLEGGSVPREYTYQLVCNALNSAGETSLLDDEVHKRIKHGIENRYREARKVKLVMSRKGYADNDWTFLQ